MSQILSRAALAATLAFALPLAGVPAVASAAEAECAQIKVDPNPVLDPLEIATAKGVLAFQVEVARTNEQRTQGLMCRKSLPERGGMLFDFKVDQPVYMWMKNTLIPLDMVFIRADGSIARIAAMTTPLSTQTISSGEPVRAVLEIGGGEARRLGLKAGDRIAHPMFPAK
ncbi:DUF192 domain-containing protein [Xanthobacter flavus]|uniref:DUF192 domain-containing protein n=1 Tax=Xanthobacter flavus TaxID=281 RepID=UPI001AE181CA|nr:DUF192 domain-containing protein [Xanthobacter flavus]MBP2151977.1 uncharacterized membrane protein (UPF0127 family) [Xanthobacter flavus]